VVVDVADASRAADFWSNLLDRPVAGEGRIALADGLWLAFAPAEEPKAGKNRAHLDLASTSAEHQAALVARARELGARPVDLGQGDVPWVVLADPDGNEFCVLEQRDEYARNGPVAAVVVDSLDPVAQAGFWAAVTGLPVAREHPDYASVWQDAGPAVEFVRVAAPERGGHRLRFDVVPLGADPAAEVARLEARGAVRVDAGRADLGRGDVPWVALADPEGNGFRVLAP
jgi:hypothetical protein